MTGRIRIPFDSRLKKTDAWEYKDEDSSQAAQHVDHSTDVGDLDGENHGEEEPGRGNHCPPCLLPPHCALLTQHQVLQQRVHALPEKRQRFKRNTKGTGTCRRRAIWDRWCMSWLPWQWERPWQKVSWPSSWRWCHRPPWSQRWGSQKSQPPCTQRRRWRWQTSSLSWSAWWFCASCRSRSESPTRDTEDCIVTKTRTKQRRSPGTQSRWLVWQQRHLSILQACVWSLPVCGPPLRIPPQWEGQHRIWWVHLARHDWGKCFRTYKGSSYYLPSTHTEESRLSWSSREEESIWHWNKLWICKILILPTWWRAWWSLCWDTRCDRIEVRSGSQRLGQTIMMVIHWSNYRYCKTQKHLITNDDEECDAGAEAIHLNQRLLFSRLFFCYHEWVFLSLSVNSNGWLLHPF